MNDCKKFGSLTVEITRFDESDVIAASGSAFYWFEGLGNDRTAASGAAYSVTVDGVDVTDQPPASSAYSILHGDQDGIGHPNGISGIDTDYSASTLAEYGITDGAYTFDGHKTFTKVQ